MYYYTGIQHTKSGDVAIPVLGFETKDAAMDKWHKERSYAFDNADFLGLTTIIFDNTGAIALNDNWVREVAPAEVNP